MCGAAQALRHGFEAMMDDDADICRFQTKLQVLAGRHRNTESRHRIGALHMAGPADPRSNYLLAALIDAGCLGATHPECVKLRAGQRLYWPDANPSHVYFPSDAVVSLIHILKNGAPIEFAVVGNDGMVGVPLLLGGASTPSHAVVQNAGEAFRIDAQTFRDGFERSGATLHLLLRYTQALITQIAQMAVCNRHHVLEQQLCRVLLFRLDRSQSDELPMTQEQIADLLGVRRASVTQAAFRLQTAGLIRYARGRIVVLDRAGLEERSCECYAVVKREYDRLLPEARATRLRQTRPPVWPAWARENWQRSNLPAPETARAT
jgi:CRP-like cAMP-binding protein